jgi:hypothetical protein
MRIMRGKWLWALVEGSVITQEKVQKEVTRYVQQLKEKAKLERYLTEGSQ